MYEFDDDLLRKLIFEPVVSPINKAYRSSFARSCLTLLYFYTRSRFADVREPQDMTAPVVCFGFFKNELHALDEAIARHPTWRKVSISLRDMNGVDWSAVLLPAPRLLGGFIRRIAKLGGMQAVRNFVYPFIGLLLFHYFKDVFARLAHRPVVVTTNLVHPLSVGVHLAARSSDLDTMFWEHAMTPRFMAKDCGYSRYYVNCEHTRSSFIGQGVPEEHVELIRPDSRYRAPALPELDASARVGVAVNDLDDPAETEDVVQLLRRLGMNPVLRVHDSDRRFENFRRMAERTGAEFSSAAQSSIHAFMQTVDLVIAGNSNVVLDFIKARRPVLYYWAGDKQLFDYYGIVGAASCQHAAGIAELEQVLRSIIRGNHATV